MSEVPSVALEAARALWAAENVDTSSAAAIAAAIEQAVLRLQSGLGRWIGVEGYRVLLKGVIDEASSRYPVLPSWRCLTGGEREVSELVHSTGAAEVISGFVRVVELLIDRLRLIVGQEMALQLVDLAWTTPVKDSPMAGTSRSLR